MTWNLVMKSWKVAIGVMVGITIGALIGVLFAPY